MKLSMDYSAAYSQMHQRSEKAFAGYSIKNYLNEISALVKETSSQTLLDYGSGKGYQYLAKRMHDAWGGILPVCYDVGVRQLSERPTGTFDGVLSTDVLEHIAEVDVDQVLDDIFSFAEAFVFLAIACRKSKKILPDGRDAHLCIKPRNGGMQSWCGSSGRT
jgi:hypothetical protein